MKSATPADLRRLQARSLGFVLIRCGQLFNDRGLAQVNTEVGRPMLREAHTRLIPHLQTPDGIRVTTLAQKLRVTKQAVQQLVADMVELGVVRIAPDPDDARARRVVLTALGLAAMMDGTNKLLDIERTVAARLGKRETKQLHELLSDLLVVLEEPA